ncbi:MAG: hypothetical protein KIT09_26995 [Bryobacteraceae bacterium]|nr:hypothetical protein [Bryobacteraceae bacterium]
MSVPIAGDQRPRRIFLLSPANAGGKRAGLLLRPEAQFDLAVRLREGAATLGEVFAFISGLYFRGKLAYAVAFAAPPAGMPAALVITAGQGLMPPETRLTIEKMRQICSASIDPANPSYRAPLERDCRALRLSAPEECDFVLLGSVATRKYLEPMADVFGSRLVFPEEFAGRGDMSRGGLMLRCVLSASELTYAPVGTVTRHGARSPKLPPLSHG